MNNKTNKYYKDIVAITIFSLIYFTVLIIGWGKFGQIVYDTGREVFVPELVLQGKMLYRDVFTMYNPLSYQLNAIFYAIFGINFNTLFAVAAVNTYLILIGCYLISRQFISTFASLIPTVAILGLCIFPYKADNMSFLFPYSYGMTYALTAFIFFILFVAFYIKSDNSKKFAYIASFFMGLSFALRYEYVLAYLPFLYLLIKNKTPLKHILLNIFLFLLPNIISWGVLFLQGLTISDFTSYFEFGKNLFNTEEQKDYQKVVLATPFAFFYGIKNILVNTIVFVFLISINCIFLKQIQNKTGIKKVIYIIPFTIISLAGYIPILEIGINGLWFICLILLYIALNTFNQSTNKDKIFFILSLCIFLSCMRLGFVFPLSSGYCLYYIALPLIIAYAYFVGNKPKNLVQKSTALYLIILSVLNIFGTLNTQQKTKTKIESQRGAIYTTTIQSNVYNDTIKWINSNTKSTDTILVLPESPMLNFMTNRPTSPMHIQLLPNHIKSMGGEDKIIKDLKLNLPDYIIIQSVSCTFYGKAFLGIDYGQNIGEFIVKNYEFVRKIKSESPKEEFFMTIFKLKKI